MNPIISDHRSCNLQDYLPIYTTDLRGNEKRYLLQCIENNQLSSGNFVHEFENAFAAKIGVRNAISVTSGTTALHLALHALGVGPGDEVIVPTFTFIATVNAVIQTGARPVFSDCDPATWVVTPDTVRSKITSRTKAVILAHLYTAVCDCSGFQQLAEAYNLDLVEDCAQAIGACFKGRHVGSWGKVGTFSFFGNKTITAGEGGIVSTDDDALAERLRSLRNHASNPSRRYWHAEPGFNYKMTNMSAAIGLAQIERLDDFLGRKKAIAARYRKNFANVPVQIQDCHADAVSAEWLFSLLLPEGVDRERVLGELHARGVEGRPVFCCVHAMPPYPPHEAMPEAERIARLGISLPSYPGLTNAEVDHVCAALKGALHVGRPPR